MCVGKLGTAGATLAFTNLTVSRACRLTGLRTVQSLRTHERKFTTSFRCNEARPACTHKYIYELLCTAVQDVVQWSPIAAETKRGIDPCSPSSAQSQNWCYE